jgi:hypothetical protein
MRRTSSLLAAVLMLPGLASAAPVLSLTDYPLGSVPAGSSFTLTIRLDDAIDLYSYTIPLFMNGPAGSTPGVDYDFDPLPSLPVADYVFGNTPTGNFLATKDTNPGPNPEREQLTVGDYLNAPPGVNTGAGNNVIAVVTVKTAPSFSGPLIFNLSTDLPFELLDSNGNEITGTTVGGPVTINVTPSAIPEPATFALVLCGLAVLGGHRLAALRRSGR